jgi:nucleoside-diphosphate-sugar epimerase
VAIILVLGGTGFLGRRLVAGLESSWAGDVVVASRHVPDSADGRHVQADLTDASALGRLLADLEPDAIVNAAGQTTGQPEALRRANVDTVKGVLEAIRRADCPARLVHIGSSAEAGPGTTGRSQPESDPPRPASPYGASKLEATQAVLESALDPPAIVLRVFNPVGPGAPSTSLTGSAIAAFREALDHDSSIVRMGPLHAFRDFFHVDDVADAVVAALRQPEASGVVNIGSGLATRARDLVQRLASIAAYPGAIVEDAPGGDPRSGAVEWQQADLTRAQHELAWAPMRTLDQALREAWLASNPYADGAPASR